MAEYQSVVPSDALDSSSPPPIFSDHRTHSSSLPSSPPGFPWEKQQRQRGTSKDTPRSPSRPTRNAFSLLGKRKLLHPLEPNSTLTSKKPRAASAKSSCKAPTQMQISLGQETQKKCKTCGMEYVPSSDEDRTLHDKYHRQNTEGYEVGKDFVQKARDETVFSGVSEQGSICAVDLSDKPGRKRRAEGALEVVQRELGAVSIDGGRLWGLSAEKGEPRHRAYLYVRGSKCVGFLLVERIKEAVEVLEPLSSPEEQPQCRLKETEGGQGALSALKARQRSEVEKLKRAESQPIRLSQTTCAAQVGISRIWTSPTHRGQNIATALLNAALRHHTAKATRGSVEVPDEAKGGGRSGGPEAAQAELEREPSSGATATEVPTNKNIVALSQPTEAGAKLARKWFGKPWGWSVYLS